MPPIQLATAVDFTAARELQQLLTRQFETEQGRLKWPTHRAIHTLRPDTQAKARQLIHEAAQQNSGASSFRPAMMVGTSDTTTERVDAASKQPAMIHPAAAQAANATNVESLNDTIARQTEQLEMLKREIEHSRRMATLGELTSTTTHEFNNLLMTILNYAKLGMRHKDEPSRDKAFSRIYDAANRATKVTSSVLAMARSKSGQMEAVSLRQLIDDTLMLLEREFRKFRVQLECQLDEVPQVIGAGNDLQRVLVNLLVNARQATPEGGLVRVSLKHDGESREVVLTIRDTGTGIAPDVLPRIFDPFFSTKTGPDSTGKGGTGVGLSSCKETIDAHSGRIRVESSLGKGTAFIIRLPAIK